MTYVRQNVEDWHWAPGTVLVVPADVPPFEHYLIVDFVNFHDGVQYAIHNLPGTGVLRVPLAEAIDDKPITKIGHPRSPEAGLHAALRMQSLIGSNYDLLQWNCEHVVRWAAYGKAESTQVSTVGWSFLFAGVIAFAACRKG